MKLFVGLGNPGDSYVYNRHNVGFLFLDRFLESKGVEFGFSQKFSGSLAKFENNYYLKPMDFMNSSGRSVSRVSAYYSINPSDIYLIHDDLDIALGQYKIQLGHGPKVHGGVLSVESMLGTKLFWRIRVGVDGRRKGVFRKSGEDYVLSNFSKTERKALYDVFDTIYQHELFTGRQE